MVMHPKITVEVAYAKPDQQRIITLSIEQGATIECVIQQSGILFFFPEIDLCQQAVGIFGKRAALSDKVQDGDRVEIYRPLMIDPKESRRRRAG
ncbi:MAG: RnfH family protein [Gammaproteobacteria bacterium RIFCSPHIGHO2_12_FULL_37_34]|nr:MAG: RnfH family protein [Gammaproteobacteria bacterium RIFCSPHIGHO2_12_FULL_37_34]